jgi:type I restriction enzyme S subunit
MMQSQIVRKSSTSTMKYIGVGKIGELLLPLPAKDEQCGISIALRNIDEKFDVAQKRSKLLSLLFKSMLHQLMTGRIRVNNTEIPFDA